MKKSFDKFWLWLPLPILILLLALFRLNFYSGNVYKSPDKYATNPFVRAVPINQPPNLILKINNSDIQVTLKTDAKVRRLITQLPNKIHYINHSALAKKHTIMNNTMNHGTLAYAPKKHLLIFGWSSTYRKINGPIIGQFKYSADFHQVEHLPGNGVVTIKRIG